MTEIALLGKKIGMTREFYKSGQSVPVTVVKMEKARVIDVINKEKRGYQAIQVGFGKIKASKLTIVSSLQKFLSFLIVNYPSQFNTTLLYLIIMNIF